VDNKALYTWILRNPDTKAGFYTLQQDESRSRSKQVTTVTVQTSIGTLPIAGVELDGRQSKIIATDFRMRNLTLIYSSGEILTYGAFKNQTVLVLYLRHGQRGEFALTPDAQDLKYKTYGQDFQLESKQGGSSSGKPFFRYSWSQPKGQAVVNFSNGLVVYLLDQESAWTFFAPPTTLNPNVLPDEHLFVLGPHLVRNATVSGDTIHVIGDSSTSSAIEIYAGDPSVKKIIWNSKVLQGVRMTEYGSLIGRISGPTTKDILLSSFQNWKYSDSLPEIVPGYNDSKWVIANKITKRPGENQTSAILTSSNYGFHSGIKIYRALFDGKDSRGLNLTIQGGAAFGWNTWLNGHFLGGDNGNASRANSTFPLEFKDAPMKESNNELTILSDYHGHDQSAVKPSGPLNSRGIVSAHLYDFAGKRMDVNPQWKIQGNAGGEQPVDQVRGPMNEGGLYGERLGWHLPGFDTSKWTSASPLQGLDKAGVAFYVTKFKLDVDRGLDVPIGIELSAPQGTVARVMFFINGYQYGKYVPHIGPQTRFPLQPGLVNMNGENTLAVSLWAQTEQGAKLADIKLIKYGVYETGFNFSHDWAYLQPGWTKDRLKYA
jgi:hypothetical protein